jgi:hypothetical protein
VSLDQSEGEPNLAEQFSLRAGGRHAGPFRDVPAGYAYTPKHDGSYNGRHQEIKD